MTYNSFMSKQREKAEFLFADVYSALAYAETCWKNENNDILNPRLLVVCKNEKENNCAFFEFPNSDECMKYVERKEGYIFSCETDKIWNGKPRLMQ